MNFSDIDLKSDYFSTAEIALMFGVSRSSIVKEISKDKFGSKDDIRFIIPAAGQNPTKVSRGGLINYMMNYASKIVKKADSEQLEIIEKEFNLDKNVIYDSNKNGEHYKDFFKKERDLAEAEGRIPYTQTKRSEDVYQKTITLKKSFQNLLKSQLRSEEVNDLLYLYKEIDKIMEIIPSVKSFLDLSIERMLDEEASSMSSSQEKEGVENDERDN